MSLGFKSKYDQWRDNAVSHEEEVNSIENYDAEKYALTICFVWTDSNRIFLSYSYLISGEFIADENKIILSFTSHVFTLSGIHLEHLFYDLMMHKCKQIFCLDERYNQISEEKSIVNLIEVKTKQE